MVDKEKHRIAIDHKVVTWEEASKAHSEGKTVVLYWSDYPESGMAYAGEVITGFERTIRPLDKAIFTVMEVQQ